MLFDANGLPVQNAAPVSRIVYLRVIKLQSENGAFIFPNVSKVGELIRVNLETIMQYDCVNALTGFSEPKVTIDFVDENGKAIPNKWTMLEAFDCNNPIPIK